MTDKDAICVLACIAIDLTGCLAGLSSNEPMADVLKQRINAINAAQVAIQERIDREMGCRWCRPFEDDPQFLIGRGNGQYDELTFKFCPMCGRKLKPAMPGEEQRG
nr:MAG TPA: NADH-PPase NADH pyrophosphatase zinc ribbon domain [Caudoviricetes sp.]